MGLTFNILKRRSGLAAPGLCREVGMRFTGGTCPLAGRLGPVLAALAWGFASAASASDWAVLQYPPSITVTVGSATPNIYGRFYSAGLTEPAGPSGSVVAQIGYGPVGSDPTVNPGAWTWVSAVFNQQYGNDDEYQASLTIGTPGDYDYAARFSYVSGTWVYGDLDGSTNGYSPGQAGRLTVSALPGFYPVTPCRLVDTRSTQALAGGSVRTFTVTGLCGIPATAVALAVNMTAVGATARGNLTLYPGDLASAPLVSSINFVPAQTRANNAIVSLAADGAGTLKVKNGSAGTVDFVLDVSGFFY
jgi:hypothetical protein